LDPFHKQDTKSKWVAVAKAMEEAEAAEQPRAFCKALEFLLDRVNAMRIDAANARLRLIAPVIKDHGIDYERGKLADELKNGTLTLERTEEWLPKAMRRELAANTVSLQSVLDGKPSAFVRIHMAAMLHLVAGGDPVKPEAYPETLRFDVHRLAVLQAEFKYIALASAMLVTVGNRLAATRNPADAQILGVIAETFVPDARTVIDVEQTVADIGKALEGSSLTPEAQDALVRQLLQCAKPTDAVNQLLTQRTRAFWSRIDQDGQVPADVQFMSAAKGLVPRIGKAASKLSGVAKLNRSVHVLHYNRIIAEGAQQVKDAQATQVAEVADAMSDN
jgi:T-complex protein 11